MKKFCVIALLALTVALSSAESYQELMDQAKKAESENKLVTALGLYYDASFMPDSEKDAEIRFEEISNALKTGKPGLSEDDDIFSVNDKWIELRKDFRSYFLNNCPWTLYFYNKFERVNLNTDTKTADYRIEYLSAISKKYKIIKSIIEEGSPKEASDKVPLIIEGSLRVKDLTSAPTWSKEWYETLDKKLEEIYDVHKIPFYFEHEYKYGSKEQQYYFYRVSNTDLSDENITFEDLVGIINDSEAFNWVSPDFYPINRKFLYVTIGLFEGNSLVYEVPYIRIESKDLTSDGNFYINGGYYYNLSFIENDTSGKKSLLLKNIPQDVANKIEKNLISYSITESYIPYGFYDVKDTNKKIPMKLGYVKRFDSNFKVNNPDRMYHQWERLHAEQEQGLDVRTYVYKTNVFGNASELIKVFYSSDKDNAKRIIENYSSSGWKCLWKNYDSDFNNQFEEIKKNLDLLGYAENFWVEEDLNKVKINISLNKLMSLNFSPETKDLILKKQGSVSE